MRDELYYVDGYYLDKYQIDCIKCNKNLLVVSGAGCGKTSTIIGKVKYLINNNYNETEILCISLTNEAVNNLRNKLINNGFNVVVLTFHKLGLNIINMYNRVSVVSNNLLEYIVDEYFKSIVTYSFRKYYLMLEFKSFNIESIFKTNAFIQYKKDIVMFINLLKNKGYDINKIYDIYKKRFVKYNYLFLLEVYKIYDNELRSTNSIDLNDMISIATNIVKSNNIKLKYKYIIIDEFQDTSLIRLNLILSIINNNNCKLMCVGDDYQSIYRFAGSDIDIFLNFKKYVKDSEIMYLKKTYRNSIELLFISTKFICKNMYQLKKELISEKHNDKPIKILYSNNKKEALESIINNIDNEYMIIGRNNKDIYNYVDKLDVINNYFTVHKSKGLESDNVILINLTNNIMGFPSKIKNNKLINSLYDKPLYNYDEERRLFYVALTRTKNNVYIILDKDNISIFVKELIKDYKEYIEII